MTYVRILKIDCKGSILPKKVEVKLGPLGFSVEKDFPTKCVIYETILDLKELKSWEMLYESNIIQVLPRVDEGVNVRVNIEGHNKCLLKYVKKFK